MVVCQICFEHTEDPVTQICRRACPAVVCVDCAHEYIRVQTQSVLVGLVVKLNCPICVRPTNLMRWRERLGKHHTPIDDFEKKIECACDVKCPNCHIMGSMLPPRLESTGTFRLPTHLARHVPDLRLRCRRYCRHRISTDELYDYIVNTFAEFATNILNNLLPLVHDMERRSMLFMRWRRDVPFIVSPCCNANVCYTCKTEGHHNGQPCASLKVDVDIAQCPGCHMHLVKGDGCDSMHCFCGYEFSWEEQRVAYRFSTIPVSALQKLACLVKAKLPQIRRRLFFRELSSTEAFFNAHMRSLASSFDNVLDPWLGHNGITMGMSLDDLVKTCPDVFDPTELHECPVAPEVTNYCCRYVLRNFMHLAHLFPALVPECFYYEQSYICFMFDEDNCLRLLSLRFFPKYMQNWAEPRSVPLLKYFNTVFDGLGKNTDKLLDYGHTVVSIQQLQSAIHVEFVDPRAAPVINDRSFSPYLQDKYLREIVVPQCKRPEIRKAMLRVKHYLQERTWHTKWKQVLADIERQRIAQEAEAFWTNYWSNISKEDMEELDNEMHSILDIDIE